jgi:hypothetical protein
MKSLILSDFCKNFKGEKLTDEIKFFGCPVVYKNSIFIAGNTKNNIVDLYNATGVKFANLKSIRLIKLK